MGRIWKILTRKKVIDPVTAEETRLRRSLNAFDLTALGVGSTLGVGVYVLAGQVAKDIAGPSVILSFLIAAIASVFAGLCYAEFGARAPRAGSAYIYSYVCVGEFVAFVIGWNLILEYVIGSASVARGLSLYLDTLLNNTLQNTFRTIAPINVTYLATYFDFFSFGISILLAICLAFGLRESSKANNIITCLNIGVVIFIIIAGALHANPANWHITTNNTNYTNSTIIGDGGFFPWGVQGMIKGAATCFYGFVGFDCIATTGEEVKNPRKSIPLSIVVSLSIIFLAYFGVATVLTLMVPYYLQDYNAPIPKAFETIGWDWAKWIVAIGALFGLCASLFGAMFPLPRIIYAMGSDGLVFRFLAKVHPRFQSPVVGTLLAGLLTGLMAALFDLSQLVNMMSIGTLQAYTIVAASVLLLRYNDDSIRQNFDGPTTSDQEELLTSDSVGFARSLKNVINCSIKQPNRITENIVAVDVLLYCVFCVAIGLCVIYMGSHISNGDVWAVVIISVVVSLTLIILLSLMTQPKSRKELSFKVPLVPLIPALSILVNIYLMLMLDFKTWVRFAVWMAVGLPMYYIGSCQPKLIPIKQQNGDNYTSNLTNGHAKASNGLSNPAFILVETNGSSPKQYSTKKKLPAPPPPTIYEQTESQHEHEVLAELDEVLDKEVAIGQLDDVLNAEILNERKLSAGTLSNVSAVASNSEDVIADVHRADVSTPVADPKTISFPIVARDTPLPPDGFIGSGNSQKNHDYLQGGAESFMNGPNNSLKRPDNKGSAGVGGVEIKSEQDSFSSTNTNFPKQASQVVRYGAKENVSDASIESKKHIPPPPPLLQLANESESAAQSVEKSAMPTASNLKSVTLRHVEQQIKDVQPTDSNTASDTNLRVGSQEYKYFVDLLDNRLKNTPNRPSIYVPLTKDHVFVKPKTSERNENVIEDKIDHTDAREKLKVFYQTRNAPEAPSRSAPTVPPMRQGLRESKSVDDSLLQRTDTKSTFGARKAPLGSPLLEHKSNMENVFGSMKFKKLDDNTLKRRLSKSLSSKFAKEDDQTNHKRKMTDIFVSINALRRESVKE
ncbi:high affinity cationic amino acid transporter 1-like isoform X2 [Euwallacea fornicatus]|uniref:high affinity cationic amino acid transporter 1-like isoform X2 n=1 Tax=Euwallacea fornicatus TaxID=995702 RepID=UPI00338DCACE